jgi:hypothetical protein
MRGAGAYADAGPELPESSTSSRSIAHSVGLATLVLVVSGCEERIAFRAELIARTDMVMSVTVADTLLERDGDSFVFERTVVDGEPFEVTASLTTGEVLTRQLVPGEACYAHVDGCSKRHGLLLSEELTVEIEATMIAYDGNFGCVFEHCVIDGGP